MEEGVDKPDKEESMDVSEELSSDSDSEPDEEAQEKHEKQLRQKVEELKKQLAENALYYAGHVNLIAALRELLELEEARKAREKMSEVYPLTAELWLQWIQDEQKVCTSEEERKFIIELFDGAVKDYMNVQMWVEYVMFMLGCGDMEATRAVGDRALTAVGTHVAEGVLVWQVVMMVEKQVYAVLMKPGAVPSEQDLKDQEKQLRRIQGLFKRQVRVPLLNYSSETLLDEASDFFEGDIDSYMIGDLKKSQNKLKEKVPFEDELVRTQSDAEKLAVYRRYITHVKETDNPAAVQSLYERAVADHCLDPGLWEEYVKFAIRQFTGLDYVVLPVCERSQRNCPWSATLCELHITALQVFAVEGEEESTATKVKDALEKGLGCGIQSGSEATRMWMAYLVFLRRQIKWDHPHDTQLDFFREAALQAINSIDKYFGEEGDLASKIPRFLAQIEAEYVQKPERAREIWNETVMKRNNNYKDAKLWLEFINLERSYGTEKHCRKLFRRALERVWEWVEVIGSAYLSFEEETGTLESMEEFNRRYEDRMVIVNKKRAEDAIKIAEEEGKRPKEKLSKKEKKRARAENYSNSTTQGNDVFKHPLPVTRPAKALQQGVQAKSRPTANGGAGNKESPSPALKGGVIATPDLSSADVAPPPGYQKSYVAPPPGYQKSDVAPLPGYQSGDTPSPIYQSDDTPPPGYQSDVAPPPGYKSSAAEKLPSIKRKAHASEDEPHAKTFKVEELHGVLTKQNPRDDMCTIFLSNLDYHADKEDIYPVFKSCGEIADFRLVKDYKCRSKGFGYLVFKTHEGAVKGLELDRALVNGRPVYVSPYDPENHTHKFKYSSNAEKEKLFVRGLPFSMTEDDIKEAFEPHGKIKEVRLVTYRNGHSKGTCYVEYDNAETAMKVCQAMDGVELEGKKITVFISDPSAKRTPSVQDAPILLGSSSRPKQGAGMRGKGMFSLMPRALQRKPAVAISPASPSSPAQTSPSSPAQTSPSSPEHQDKKMSNDDFRNMLLKK